LQSRVKYQRVLNCIERVGGYVVRGCHEALRRDHM